jgi:hypothetical protein
VAMKVLKPTEGTFRVRPVARSHTAGIAQTITLQTASRTGATVTD